MAETESRLAAFHGDATLKATTIAEMRRHREQELLVQGRYWDGHKGCAVACMTHDQSGNGGHHLYPERWGIPEQLAHLEDAIFEGLPTEEANQWPLDFLEAIPVGADLSLVADRLCLWILEPEGAGLLDRSRSDVRAAIDRTADLYRRRISGDEPSNADWSAARSAAESAARSASAAWSAWSARSARSAESAAESAAWSARSAESAAESAAWSARSAESAESAESAWSAARSAAWSAAWSARSARSAAWKRIAAKLLDLLREAPAAS